VCVLWAEEQDDGPLSVQSTCDLPVSSSATPALERSRLLARDQGMRLARPSVQIPPSENGSGRCRNLCIRPSPRDQCIYHSKCGRSAVFVRAPRGDLRISRRAKYLRRAEFSISGRRQVSDLRRGRQIFDEFVNPLPAGFQCAGAAVAHCFENPKLFAPTRLRRFRRSDTHHLARGDGSQNASTHPKQTSAAR